MQSEMDSLYWDWQSKNHITLGENCTMASTNPVVSDSIYMDRLSRIPSIIEMPYNEAVRKFIDMYAVRLRNKVSFMLAATNFYMPIFEEALDLYDLPQELKYLPIIESALNPVAVSRHVRKIGHDVVCRYESRNVPTGFFGQIVVDCPIIRGSSGTAYGFVDSARPAVVSCQYQIPVLIVVVQVFHVTCCRPS